MSLRPIRVLVAKADLMDMIEEQKLLLNPFGMQEWR